MEVELVLGLVELYEPVPVADEFDGVLLLYDPEEEPVPLALMEPDAEPPELYEPLVELGLEEPLELLLLDGYEPLLEPYVEFWDEEFCDDEFMELELLGVVEEEVVVPVVPTVD